MTAKPLYYLATVYRKHPGGLDAAYEMACREAARLCKVGIAVFSPIVHGHGLSVHGGINPTDHDLWMAIDTDFVEVCTAGLIVLRSAGWDESDGIAEEIEKFKQLQRPIIHMNPGFVPEPLLWDATA